MPYSEHYWSLTDLGDQREDGGAFSVRFTKSNGSLDLPGYWVSGVVLAVRKDSGFASESSGDLIFPSDGATFRRLPDVSTDRLDLYLTTFQRSASNGAIRVTPVNDNLPEGDDVEIGIVGVELTRISDGETFLVGHSVSIAGQEHVFVHDTNDRTNFRLDDFVAKPADVAITNFQVTGTGEAGDPITVAFGVENQGDVAMYSGASGTVEFLDSSGNVLQSTGISTGRLFERSAASSVNGSPTSFTPAENFSGAITVRVSLNTVTGETDTADNTRSQTVGIISSGEFPDLVVRDIALTSFGSDPKLGQDARLSFNIVNIGEGVATSSRAEYIVRDADGNILLQGDIGVIAIAGNGGSSFKAVDFAIPASALAGTFTVEVVANSDSSTPITEVQNDASNTGSATFVVGVANRAPTGVNDSFSITDLADLATGTFRVEGETLLSDDIDPDGDRLEIVSVAGLGIGSWQVVEEFVSGVGTLKTVVVTGVPSGQTAQAVYTLKDPAGLTSTAVVSVFNPGIPNRDPVAGSFLDQIVKTTDDLRFDVAAEFSDPDGDTLRFASTGLPAGLEIDSATGVLSGRVANPFSGTITVTATDGKGGSALLTFSLDVTRPAVINTDPTSTALADQTYTVAQTVSIDVGSRFSDTDGDNLTFSATGLPAGLELNRDTGLLSGSVSTVFSGPVVIFASDGRGGTARLEFDLTVQPEVTENNDPVAAAFADQTIGADEVAFIDLGRVFSDPDGDTLTFSAIGLPAGLEINGDTGYITGTASGVFKGPITVTANDGQGGVTSFDFELTVTSAPNVAPDTGQLVLETDSVWASTSGGGTANGTFFLGHQDGLQRMLRVEGATVEVNANLVSFKNATVFSELSYSGKPLFTGDFIIDLNTLSTTVLVEEERPESFDFTSFMEVDFSAFTINEDHVRFAAGVIADPDYWEYQSNKNEISLILSESGFTPFLGALSTGSFLSEHPLELSTKTLGGDQYSFSLRDIAFYYDVSSSAFYLSARADAAISILGSTRSVTIDLAGTTPENPLDEGSKFLRFSGLADGTEGWEWDIVGDLNYSVELETDGYGTTSLFAPSWGIREFNFSLDTISNEFVGHAKIAIPFMDALEIDASIGFFWDPFQINYLQLELNDVDRPIFSTGFYLQHANLQVDNLAGRLGSDPVKYEGELQVTFGSKDKSFADASLTGSFSEGNFEAEFLAESTFRALLTDKEAAKIGSGDTSGSGLAKALTKFFGVSTADLLNYKIMDLEGNLDFDSTRGIYEFTGTANFLNGLLGQNLTFSMNRNLDFYLSTTTSITFPDDVDLPFLGGKSFDLANLTIQFTKDGDFSNDYLALWIDTKIPFVNKIGFMFNFDDGFELLGNKEIEALNDTAPLSNSTLKLPTAAPGNSLSESWRLEGDMGPVILQANWSNEVSNARLVLIGPKGREYSEAAMEKLAFVDLIDDLTTTTSRGLVIKTPNKGVWSLRVESDSSVGAVDFFGTEAIETISVDVVNAVRKGGRLILTVDVEGLESEGALSVYLGDDETGIETLLAASNLVVSGNGRFKFEVPLSNIPIGDYVVVASLDAPGAVPATDSAKYSFEISEIADLSVSIHQGYNFRSPFQLNFTISIENEGSKKSSGSVLLLDAPFGLSKYGFDGVDYEQVTVLEDGRIRIELGGLQAGEELQISFSGKVSDVVDGEFISAFLTPDDGADVAANNRQVFSLGTEEARTANSPDKVTEYADDIWVIGDDVTLSGLGGHDTFQVSGGMIEYVIFGGSGDDLVFANNAANTIYGEAGNDDLQAYGGHDTIFGGTGNDSLRGGDGNDAVWGGAGDDWLLGGLGDDILTGGLGNDNFFAGSGDDSLTGGAGNDYLNGEDGDDQIFGGSGDDRLYGQGGYNTLFGGDGDDYLSLLRGSKTTATGGNGADEFAVDLGMGDAVITDFEFGIDSLNFYSDSDAGMTSKLNADGDRVLVLSDGSTLTMVGIPINFSPTGKPTLTGTPGVGRYLGVETGDIADADGLGVFGYQWLRDGNIIIGGTTSFYQLRTLDVGSEISVRVSYTDGFGTNETLDSGSLTLADPYLGDSSDNTITGDSRSNSISGLAGDDSLFGLGGDDTILGGGGNDNLIGGIGDDRLLGNSGDDTIRGGGGNDVVLGGKGRDQIWLGKGDDVFKDETQNDKFGADTVYGEKGNDKLFGRGGKDTLNGGDGNDVVNGGANNDQLLGGRGDDTIRGGDGNDVLYGGSGDDTLAGGAGNNSLFGGSGIDTAAFSGNRAEYTFKFDGTTSILQVSKGSAVNILKSIENVEFADGAFDLADLVGVSRISILGTEGADDIVGTNASELIFGLGGDDSINGLFGDDEIHGGDGNDYLYGVGKNVLIYGGDGNDRIGNGGGNGSLYGGDGDDYLFSQGGTEAFFGGKGTDTVSYSGWRAGVGIDLMDASTNFGVGLGDTFKSVENLRGSGESDTLLGDENKNVLEGLDSSDTLSGRSGNDMLFGGGGDDILTAGPGKDILWGGSGHDVFYFALGNNKDIIQDFQDDVDTIRLDTDLWSGTLNKQQVVNKFASVIDGDIVFDFGKHKLTLKGFDDLSELRDDITII